MASTFLNIFLFMYSFAETISVLLYVFMTEETIRFFNGIVTPTALFWTKTSASGDLLLAFIGFRGLMGDFSMKKFAVQCYFVYGVAHFGSFWYSSTFIEKHQSFMETQYLPNILIVSLALYFWGLKDKNE
jgi:hypothetical protein